MSDTKIEEIEIVKVVKVFERKVWIESCFLGDKHIMIQHLGLPDGDTEPFEIATVRYNHMYNGNSSIWAASEKIAVMHGATEPVERKHRKMEFKP